MNIGGSIELRKTIYPLSIKGNVFKSSLFNNTLICDATNLNSDFDVVYLSITENKDLVYDKSLFAVDTSQTFQLYLLKKDTREFITFEIPMSAINLKQEQHEELLIQAEAHDIDNKLLEHWWVTVFKPVIKEELVENQIGTDFEIMSESSSQMTIYLCLASKNCIEWQLIRA